MYRYDVRNSNFHCINFFRIRGLRRVRVPTSRTDDDANLLVPNEETNNATTNQNDVKKTESKVDTSKAKEYVPFRPPASAPIDIPKRTRPRN